MTSSGENGEISPDKYVPEPGYGEVPSLPQEGYGESAGQQESYWEIPATPSPIEQYPGYPPPSYTPTPEPQAQYQQPQYQQPPQYQQYQQPPQDQQYQQYQQPPQYGPPSQFGGYVQPVGTNGLAIASLVTAIVGGCFYGLGAIVAIILGVVALNQIKQTGQQGRGLAIAGIAVGASVIAMWVIFVIFIVAVGSV
ncbi:DUF4190 domain-containing protein [Rhodococcus sp. IEGM 1366]|uniref:DUF4190 domain-containing protein n=1 Tax=Rhodococcus sp. IEGM 1366 TaxID=3082223 RepID=UPI0029529F41|nr:DUF4190 domain-containing protein [Rhodococcus sp. IEGM 1366]MDV8065866.1 DUF4190 domain-containing protein [Rhodococcus sp. IEGM 1366]